MQLELDIGIGIRADGVALSVVEVPRLERGRAGSTPRIGVPGAPRAAGNNPGVRVRSVLSNAKLLGLPMERNDIAGTDRRIIRLRERRRCRRKREAGAQ